MKRIVAVLLAIGTPLSGCQLLPASGMTCDGVASEVCEAAFEEVRTLFRRSGEVVQAATISPTGRAECLHDDRPLADVVVRLEGRSDPELLTLGRSAAGEVRICF